MTHLINDQLLYSIDDGETTAYEIVLSILVLPTCLANNTNQKCYICAQPYRFPSGCRLQQRAYTKTLPLFSLGKKPGVYAIRWMNGSSTLVENCSKQQPIKEV
jgi:hypothetical protein